MRLSGPGFRETLLEETLGRLLRARVTLRDLALISHAVPAERVRRVLPAMYEPEIFTTLGGEEKTWVSVGFCRNEGPRSRLLPLPRLRFFQCTYRAYVRYQGRPGVFYFGTYVGTGAALLLRRAAMKNAYAGHFSLTTDYHESSGYDAYRAYCSSARGITCFAARATQVHRSNDLVKHLTERNRGYFETSARGIHACQIGRHAPMQPWAGELAGELMHARFDLWKRLGVLEHDREMRTAQSVLIQPEIPFSLSPPIPMLAQGASRGAIAKAPEQPEQAA